MNIAGVAIRYRTVTVVLTIMIVGGGMMAYQSLGRLEDPEFTIKEAQIFTRYPGATAMEVADEVTDEIETAVQQMGQLKLVTSISQPGLSTVRVEMRDKYDKDSLPQVWDELRRKVGDAQGSLPQGASTSIVYDDFGDVYGVFFAIYGDGYTYAELKEHADLLRRELLGVQDVAKVTLFADLPEAVYVEISRGRLAQLGIPPQWIYKSLAGQNMVSPAGEIEVGERYIRIQPTGGLTNVEQIGDVLILQDDGEPTKLRLRDVATIRRGYVDPPSAIMRFNGRPAIGIGISTIEGGNVVTMGQAIDQRLDELAAQTPIGIELGIIAHQSEAVTTSINGFVISLAEALAIVIGVLMIAMGLRSGVLIGVILLLTVLATLVVMKMQGIMLERISLGALIIALGMLVDNAIVVVEGILVNIQKGMARIESALQVVKQTMWPLFGATVVAVLAFAAIGTSQDSTGEYCRSLYQVILISLMASWLLAVTVTPLLCVQFLKVKAGSGDPYGGVFFGGYKWLLSLCLRWRWLTVIVMLGMLLVAVRGFGYVKQSFFPDSTRPQFMVHYWLPQGTHIDKTAADLAVIESHIRSLEGVTDIATFTGKGALRFLLTYSPEDTNSAYGMLLVSVDDYRNIDDLIPVIDDYISDNFLDSLAFARRFVMGPGDPSKIQIRLRGHDPDVLRGLSAQVRQVMEDEPRATDVLDDWRGRVLLSRPIIAETQARNAGLTRREITQALEMASSGLLVGAFREGDDRLPIISRAPQAERMDIDSLQDIQIWSPVAQRTIPARQVVLGFESSSENSIIRRRDRLPCLTVKCDPREGTAEPVRLRIQQAIEAKIDSGEMVFPPGYTMAWGGEFEDSGDAQAALANKLPVVGLLMFMVVVALFNSVRQPLVIFLTVPLALIGVTVGLLQTGQPFGFMALLGFLSLSGMLIKNAIVLIDEINIQARQHDDLQEAIVVAGLHRVRPVSMAAMTTVLGMIPLLGDAFFVSLAVTVMYGLAFATVLTMIVVPVLYSCLCKAPKQAD